MYDLRGKRVYDPFYCTRERIGLNRMKQAMWKIAPSGDFSFRDDLLIKMLFWQVCGTTSKALTRAFRWLGSHN
jgi:hypothetical protein